MAIHEVPKSADEEVGGRRVDRRATVATIATVTAIVAYCPST